MRRFPRAAQRHFEALEPRQLRSAAPAAPAAGDGHDYVMLAPDAGRPVVHAIDEQVKRTPLAGGFTWFDASPSQQLKDIVPGVTPIIVDDRAMFPTGADGLPMYGEAIDEANTRALARRASANGGVLALDIENWAMNVSHVGQSVVNRSVARFEQVIDWCRDEEPTLKIGIYGELPTAEVWDSEQMGWAEDTYASTGSYWHMYDVSVAANQHARWQQACDFVRPLAAKVDYLFPSLYTFYADRDMWSRFATSVIDEARTFGKPVIPFLWPTYHDGGALANTPIEDDFWAQELDTVRQRADGGALWDNVQYSAADPWVRAVNARRTSVATQRANATSDVIATSDVNPTVNPPDSTAILPGDDDRATSSRAADLLAA